MRSPVSHSGACVPSAAWLPPQSCSVPRPAPRLTAPAASGRRATVSEKAGVHQGKWLKTMDKWRENDGNMMENDGKWEDNPRKMMV